MLTKAQAQQRADDIEAFSRELERLREEQALALTPEQAEGLRQHHAQLLDGFARTHDVDISTSTRQMSLGMRVASFLGALALAASVYFMFYQFWGLLSTPLQVLILAAAPILTLAATLLAARLDASGYFSKLAALVSFACFVLNLSMLGQIFNITPSDKAFLVWGLYALLLAYSFDLQLLLVAAIACLVAFISARVGTWSGCYWIDFGERPENFFPAALLLLAAPQLTARLLPRPHFDRMYRIFGLLVLLLPILLLSNWAEGSYLDWDRVLIKDSYQTLGFLLSAAAIWRGVRSGRGEVLNTGVVFFVIFLFTKLYDWWWDTMPKWLFFLLIALLAVLTLTVLRRLRISARSAP